MKIDLGMILVIQSILCMHVELKLKFFLLRFQFYSTQRLDHLENLGKFKPIFFRLSVICYLEATTCFDRPLIDF